MKSIRELVKLDHWLTTNIRTWGRPLYGFWKFMATQSIIIFFIIALALAATQKLVLWKFALIFLSAFVVADVLQRVFRRPRPDFEHLTGYRMWFHSYSYPSAHAAVSASAATGIALLSQFSSPEAAAVTVFCCSMLAVLIGVSRLVVGVHYLADVLFGWLVGFVIALGYIVLL